MANANVSSYMKNLMKSAGYISMDVFKSYAPVMSSLASSTKEAASTGYQAIKDFTSSSNDSNFSFKGIKSKSGEVINNLWKNTVDDLKTGKIYNKERNDALGDEIASGFLGDDFNFDFDFDDDWGDDDESSSEDTGAKAQVAAEMEGAKVIASAVDAMGRGISASMTEATVESASYIASSARENSLALFNLNKEGFGTITKALMSVNDTIYQFSKIGEPLTAHMQNSSLFFAKTGESLNNIEQTLKQIEVNTKPAPVAGSKGYKTKRSLASMMSDDEGINFSELVDSFKETVDDYKDLASMFVDMFKPTAKSGGKNISLLGAGATALAKKLIPTVFEDTIKRLDESIKYGLGAGLTKMLKKRTGNMLVDTLLDMFAPTRDVKSGISMYNYEKGAVQWDGVARKALTDVIPTTLLQIYSVLSGTDPMRFDYNSGKFVKADSINKQLKKKKEQYVAESGGDFYKNVQKAIKESGKNEKDQAKMMVEAYKFFEKAFDTSDHRIYNNGEGIDPETYTMIQAVATSMGSNKKTRNFNNKWTVEANKKAADYSNSLRSEEASGFSAFQLIHDELGENAKASKGTRYTIIGLDQYGHNYYYYLQGLWQNTGYMVRHWGIGGDGENIPDFNAKDLPKIKPVKNKKSKGEKTIEQANADAGLPGSDSEEAQKAQEIKENTNKIKKWFKENVSDKTRKAVNKILGTSIDEGEFVSVGIMDSISSSIDKLIWGTKDNPEKGLFSFMFEKAKSMFEKMQEAFKTKILDRFKNWFDSKIKERWEKSEWVKDTKENLKGKWNTLKGRFKKVMVGHEEGLGYDIVPEEAAYGRQITRPGLVSVSAGEMIIPSEYNPFYHGATNKASQRNNERRVSNRYLGMFAEGTAEASYLEQLTGAVDELKGKKVKKRKITDDSILGMIGGAAAGAFAKLKNFIDDEVDSEKLEKDKKKITDSIANLLGEVGENKGEIGAGAVLGAGASILTGAVIGPIAGAALGAGIGFIRKSKTAQDFLFGAEGSGEDGQRKRQKIYDFVMKDIPAVGTGAAVGGITGLFMGSPVIGAILGSAIGFAASNEKFQDFLFGEKDENGKRTGGKLATKIFTNVDATFKNIGNRVKVWMHDLGKKLTEKVKYLFDFIEKKAKDPNSGLFGKLIGGSISLGRKIVTAPFKLTDKISSKISDSIERGNLVGGYSTYSKLEGRNLTAAERIASKAKLSNKYQKKVSKDFNKFDNFLASLDNYDELEKYKKWIKAIKTEPTGSEAYNTAVENLMKDSKYKKYMGDTGADFLKKNATKLSSLVGDEGNRLTKENDEKTQRARIENYIHTILGWVKYIATGEEPTEAKASLKKEKEVEDDKENTQDTVTPYGIIETETSKDGGKSINYKDKETNATMGRIKSLFHSIASVPSMIVGGIGKLFGIGKEGNEDEKESFLSKAKNFIGEKLSAAKEFINSIILPIGIAVATIVTTVKGLFGSQSGTFNTVVNNVAANLGLGGNPSTNSEENGTPDDNGGTKTQFQTATGENISIGTDENGYIVYYDQDGNIVSEPDVQRTKAGQDTFISRFRKTTARQLITGKPTAAGAVLKLGTKKLGNTLSSIPGVKKLTNSVSSSGESIFKLGKDFLLKNSSETVGQIVEETVSSKLAVDAVTSSDVYIRVADSLDSVLKNIQRFPLPSGVKNVLPSCFDDLATTIAKNTGKLASTASKFAQNVADIVPILNIVVAVLDFKTGYDDARTTLGITKEPTVPQRIISGLLRLLKNLIPIIGPLIPDDLVVNVCCKWIAPVFGLSDSEIMKEREEAKAEVEAYNAENGTNYNVAEYNKAVLNDYTLTERYGNVFKTTYQQTKDKISNAKTAYNNAGGGLAGSQAAIKEWIGIESIKQAYSDAGGGINGTVEGIRTAIENMAPGVLGEIGSKTVGMFKDAFTGNIVGLMSTNLDAFSKTNDKQADVSILTQAMGGLVFTPIKIALFPISLVASGIRKIIDLISPLKDKIVTVATDIDNTIGLTNAIESIKEGNLTKLLEFSAADGDDNGLVASLKVAGALPIKIISIIPTMVSAAGQFVWNKILSPIVNKVKNSFTAISKTDIAMFSSAVKGNVTDIWNQEIETDEENPVGGFTKAIIFTRKLVYTPLALLCKVGGAIVDNIKDKVTKIKNSFVTVTKTNLAVDAAALKGDISGVWSEEIQEADEENPVGGFSAGLIFANRLVSTPIALQQMLSNAIFQRIAGIFKVVKKSTSNFVHAIDDGFDSEIYGEDAEDITEMSDEEGNPISGFQMALIGIGRIVGGTLGLAVKGGKIIGDKIKYFFTKVKNSIVTFGKTSLEYTKSSFTGDPASLWTQSTVQADEDNPVGGFTEAMLFIQKLLFTPISAVGWVGRKTVVEPLMKIVDFTKNTINVLKTRGPSLFNYVINGDPEGLAMDYMADDEGNPIGGLAQGIDIGARLLLYPVAQLSKVGRIIYDKFLTIKDKVVGTINAVGEAQDQIQEYVNSGDPEGLAHASVEFSDSPVSGIANAIVLGTKLVNFMPAVVHKSGNKIKEVFEIVKSSITEGVEAYDVAREQITEYTDKGDIKGIWGVKGEYPDGPLGGVLWSVTVGTKMLSTFPAIGHTISNSVKGLFGNITSYMSTDINNLKTYSENLQTYINKGEMKKINSLEFKSSNGMLGGVFTFASYFLKIGAYLSGGVNWLGNKVKGLGETAKEKIKGSKLGQWLGFNDDEEESGTGSGLAVNSKNCTTCNSGFQSQLDPRYKDISFAGSNIGTSGCAPAVGTMVSATMGGNMDMNSAISKARAYTNNNGTSAKYFEDTFNASPLNSTSTVKTALENGRPVILLGRDPSNNSKEKSPFGPDNHYVLATGMKDGKVLVNDPESNGPKVYDKSILNKSSYNLTYGGSSRKRAKGSFTDNSDTQQIWAYLTNKLGFTEAGAAGLMGCWAEESSNNPNTIEGYYLSGYPGDEAVRTTEGLNSFTTDVLFPAYANSGININKSAYKGSDGNYYPGFGLAQWTGPRGQALHEYADTSGKAWYTLDNQMQYLSSEMNSTYSSTRDKLRTDTDVYTATKDAMNGYEGNTSTNYLNKRVPWATDIYNTYSGKTYTWEGGGDDNTSSSSSSSSSDSSSSSSGGLLSFLSNIFGSLTNIFDTKNGFKLNSDDYSSNDSSSTSGNTGNGQGAQAAANAATNEIGYPESGTNITKFGAWSGCDGQPWCAAFAAWAIAQAFDGSKDKAVKALYNCDNVNYTPTLTDTFKANNAWYNEPKVGDEVMYGNPGAYHVGLVTAVDEANKTYTSVEGNTNDQVTQKQHSSYMDGNVIGYGRPDYSGATNTVASNGNSSSSTSISGNEDFKATGSGLRGGSSGLLRKAAPSRFAYGSLKGQKFRYGGSSGLTAKNRFSGAGAGTNITKTVTRTLTNIKKNITSGSSNNYGGSINAELVEQLLVSITSLLNSINSNTAPTQQIYDVLKEYIDYVKGNKTTTSTNDQVNMPTNNNEVDTNFANLVTTLAAIARG